MMRALALALALGACAANGAPANPPIEAAYPEGPLYHEGRLYYAEMGADRVSVVEGGVARAFFTERGCGPTAIAPYGAGFVVLCHIGAQVVEVSREGAPQRRWAGDAAGVALRDPNDASADGRGGVYLSDPGAFSRNTVPHGRVMYLAADGVLRSVAERLWYPNGVYVDRARAHLYVSEHMSQHVFRYDIEGEGRIAGPDVFADISSLTLPRRYAAAYAETGPDGIEMSADGETIYIALYGEGRVLAFSREGRMLGMLTVPTRYVTNIAIAPDGTAATTGSFDNLPPYPGEVRFHTRDDLTRAPE